MLLAWRSLSASALVAGLILLMASGCKSGGGWWSPSSSKWGSAESSTSDLAVSRPTTRVPTPSSSASPTASGGLASRGAAGAQDGPYGSAAANAAGGRSGYGSQPAGWQGEPHSPVAPAGGYQTGGPYNMSSSQPGVTPGAYAQPNDQGASADNRVADERGQAYAQPGAGAYGDADAGGGTDIYGGAPSADQGGASVYQDPNQPASYAAPDSAAGYGAPPPSDAPGAISEPTGPAIDTPLYGDSEPMYGSPNSANPAAAAQPAATIANPYSLPASPRPPTSQAPTTSPATGAAPFTPPTLPSSLSGTPGSYRPGSTASPGSRYGAQNTVYEPATTASGGTGYSTADGTIMR